MFRHITQFFLIFLIACNQENCGKKNRPLHLNIPQDPSTFDPRKASDFSSSTITFFLFEGLTRSSPGCLNEPALAKDYTVSEDGLTYTFKIRDAYWADGKKITAYDFEKSWKEALSPEFPCANAHLFYPIKNSEYAKKGLIDIDQIGVHALNENTLIVNLWVATPYFIELTSFCTFFPYREDEKRNPIFSGAFQIKEFKSKDFLDLEKSRSYWDKKRVKLSGIRFYLIEDSTTALEMFCRNEIDLIGSSFTNLPTDAIEVLKKKYKLRSFETAGTSMLSFNTLSTSFQNEKLRKAICYAINRKDIVENFTFFDEKVADSIVPQILKKGGSRGFTWQTNHSLAKRYLHEALEELGIHKDDLKIRFVISSTGLFPKIAQVIQEQIRNCLDLKIVIEQLEPKVYLDRLYKHDFELAGCLILAQYHDPLAYLDRFKFKGHLRNYPGFEDSRFIELIEQSMHQGNGEKRQLLLDAAESILVDQHILLPLYHFKNGFLSADNIHNIQAFPQGTLYLDEVEIL